MPSGMTVSIVRWAHAIGWRGQPKCAAAFAARTIA